MGTTTQTFDDGSTLSYSDDYTYVSATPAWSAVNQSPDFGFKAANPAAGSWDDVLKFGFARAIDAYTRPVTQSNALPVQRAVSRENIIPGVPGTQPDSLVWLLLAGAAFFILAK